MSKLLIPGLIALFAWWFSTGLVLVLDGLPRRTFRWSMLGAAAVFVLSLAGLWYASGLSTTAAAYGGFVSGLLAWGFLEMSFLTGMLTGPRKHACPPDCRGWQHFRHGVEAILYHEIAIIAAAMLVLAVTWDAANQIGTWTFMILWIMRQSAKLNLFLGVRNLSEDFLPQHLRYLASFFRRRAMNPLFPVSVTGATVATAWLAQRAVQATSEFEATGFALLAALMGLALLEHWLLVLPIRAEALWSFGLKSTAADARQHQAATPGEPLDPGPMRTRWEPGSCPARGP